MPYDETKLVKLGHLKTLATKLNTDVTALKEQWSPPAASLTSWKV